MSRVVAEALAAHGAAGTGMHAAKAVFVIVVPPLAVTVARTLTRTTDPRRGSRSTSTACPHG